MNKFEQLGLNPAILKAVEEMGFESPSEVQEKAIPILLQKDTDMVALAQTGTGKTAAFALPIISRLGQRGSLRALILEPTRELAAQVETAIRDYGRFTNLRTIVLYGGTGYGKQDQALRRGADIVVAHMGVTTGGSIGATSARSLDDCVVAVDAIADAARSVRGGSWADTDYEARTTRRDSLDPNFGKDSVGFRCAASGG